MYHFQYLNLNIVNGPKPDVQVQVNQLKRNNEKQNENVIRTQKLNLFQKRKENMINIKNMEKKKTHSIQEISPMKEELVKQEETQQTSYTKPNILVKKNSSYQVKRKTPNQIQNKDIKKKKEKIINIDDDFHIKDYQIQNDDSFSSDDFSITMYTTNKQNIFKVNSDEQFEADFESEFEREKNNHLQKHQSFLTSRLEDMKVLQIQQQEEWDLRAQQRLEQRQKQAPVDDKKFKYVDLKIEKQDFSQNRPFK